jgi:hypothetical protein
VEPDLRFGKDGVGALGREIDGWKSQYYLYQSIYLSPSTASDQVSIDRQVWHSFSKENFEAGILSG